MRGVAVNVADFNDNGHPERPPDAALQKLGMPLRW
jgi:hypothetical protein